MSPVETVDIAQGGFEQVDGESHIFFVDHFDHLVDVLGRYGDAAGDYAVSGPSEVCGIRAAHRQDLPLVFDALFGGFLLQVPDHSVVADAGAVEDLDGRSLSEFADHFLRLRTRHVEGYGCVEIDAEVSAYGVRGRLRPAEADLLLHGENGVEVVGQLGVADFAEQFDEDIYRDAVVQGLAVDAVTHFDEFALPRDWVARAY